MKEALGWDYSTNEKTARESMPLFMPHWPEAVQRAERVRGYHRAADTPDPANPSTDVDVLVKALNYSALEHVRRNIP